ncbi:MAG: hypothetical protein ACYDCI_00055 [Candidatus Limnocylindrales bacterium]
MTSTPTSTKETMMLRLLAQIDVGKALHDYWRTSSPEAHVAIGSTGFGAYLAGINWAAVVTFLGLSVPIAWGVVVQCWKQVKLARIQIQEAQLESDDRTTARRSAATAQRAAILPSPAD